MTERVLGDGGQCCKNKNCETCAEIRPTKKTASSSSSKKEDSK